MNFKTQIESLIGTPAIEGSTAFTAYHNRLNDFLKQSARGVLDSMPDEVLIEDALIATVNDTNGYAVNNKRVLAVLRDNFGVVPVSVNKKAFLQAGPGSIHEPTRRSPVYYIEGHTSIGGRLYVKPDPTSTKIAKINYITYPSPTYDDTSINNFPDLAEYAVVLGASIRELLHKINNLIHDDEDIEIAQVAQQELQNLQVMYNQEIQRLSGMPEQISVEE